MVKKQEFLRDRLTSGLEGSSTKAVVPVATGSSLSHHPVLSEYARWKNACKFECKVCSYATKAYFTFNFHVKDKHGLVVQVILLLYSKRPKSEHVRISDTASLFGSNLCSVLKVSEIRTNLFGFQTLFNVRNPNKQLFEHSDFRQITKLGRFI